MISVFQFGALLLAFGSAAFAQVFTSTLPWVDGDTIIVSQSTDALGRTVVIQTLYVLVISSTDASG
jgi:hypothetical protein